jgi:glycosyltransferase involved in cell wall biosynthesis
MNICMVASVPLPPQEGMGYYMWNLARQLTQQGHRPQIITRGSLKGTQHQICEGIEIWRPTFVPLYPWHVHLHSLFVNQLVARLESDIDVFHVHSPLPPIIKTRRPILLTVHTPLRADVRSIPLRDISALLVKLQAPVSYWIEQRLFQQARQVVAVAASVAQELSEYGLNPTSVEVLGNGVETTLFEPANTKPEAPYVLAVGRLGLRKGFEDLIECARLVLQHIPEVRFRIAGTGPLEKSLRTQIARAGLSAQVELLGHISDRREIIRLYQHAAVFVHPAHYEGLPTVLLEAMACGRPVVATAVSGALDVIQSEVNGLLIPPHNPSKMATVILRLLSDPELANHLGQAARRTVETHYSWDRVSARYSQLYRQLVS